MKNVDVYYNGNLYTFSPADDREILMRILEQKANEITIPTFHVGNLEYEQMDNGGVIADSLQYQIERCRFSTQGSGVFGASQLDDVLEWRHARLKNEFHNDEERMQLYVIDLNRYNAEQRLCKINTYEDSEKLSSFLNNLGHFVRLNVIGQYGWEKSRNALLSQGINNLSDFMSRNENIKDILGNNELLDTPNIREWIRSEAIKINDMIKEHVDLDKEHNISTHFMKELGFSGIDLSAVYLDDSIAKGSIIYDIDRETPYDINFRDNEDIAKEFFKLVRDKVIDCKIYDIKDYDEFNELLDYYKSALPSDQISYEGYKEHLLEMIKDYKTKEILNKIYKKDPVTYGHSVRVGELMKEYALSKGKSLDEASAMQRAGYLHDTGKLAIPDEVLTKNGKLDDREYEMIKSHPVAADPYLDPILLKDKDIYNAIHYHHAGYEENTGYPRGVHGKDIPEVARICAAFDVYDALSSKRQYKEALPVEEVEKIMTDGNKTLDQEIVKDVLQFIKERNRQNERLEHTVLPKQHQTNKRRDDSYER